MQFALHEATLVLGMILQHFTFIDHTDYELDIKQTLTIKPGDFHIRVRPRNKGAVAAALPAAEKAAEDVEKENGKQKAHPLSGLITDRF